MIYASKMKKIQECYASVPEHMHEIKKTERYWSLDRKNSPEKCQCHFSSYIHTKTQTHTLIYEITTHYQHELLKKEQQLLSDMK